MSEERPVAPPPGDDDLRAMLEGRAARVPSADAREVLAAARAEIAGRGAVGSGAVERDGRTFGVQPVRVEPRATRGGRGSRMPWRVAILAIAAVVAIAVLGSRLGAVPANPDVGSSPAATASDPVPLEVLTGAALGAGIDDGSLDGRTVLVVGQLKFVQAICPLRGADNQTCSWLRLGDVPGLRIDPGPWTMGEVLSGTVRHPRESIIALAVAVGSVTFAGWVVGGLDAPRAPSQFGVDLAALQPGDVEVVLGWLQGSPGLVSCVQASPCPSSWPRLTDEPPIADGVWRAGVAGLDVALSAALPELRGSDIRHGRFLVEARRAVDGDAPGARVIASIDATVWPLYEAMPSTVEPSTPPPATSPTAGRLPAEAFAQAMRLGELDGQVVVAAGRMRHAAWRSTAATVIHSRGECYRRRARPDPREHSPCE